MHSRHTHGKFENDDGGNYEENACISHENLRSSSVISHIVAGRAHYPLFIGKIARHDAVVLSLSCVVCASQSLFVVSKLARLPPLLFICSSRHFHTQFDVVAAVCICRLRENSYFDSLERLKNVLEFSPFFRLRVN